MEVIDVILSTTYISNYIRKYNGSGKESSSDHKHTNFEI